MREEKKKKMKEDLLETVGLQKKVEDITNIKELSEERANLHMMQEVIVAINSSLFTSLNLNHKKRMLESKIKEVLNG